MVDREVVRDPQEPRGERRGLPAEASYRLEHPQECLRREVLRVVAVADTDVQVAVDAVEMKQVELFERVAVAFLRPRYEETQVDRCAVTGSRRCPVHHH